MSATTATASKLNKTDKVLIEMLTENTGCNMLDSGGAYGRNWERNQGRNFLAMPATTLEVNEYDGRGEFMVTHNVFHWLRERVTYDAKLDARFKRFANKPSNADKHWLELAEEFADSVGDGNTQTVNTYNGDDLLSQTLQYTTFETDNGYFILLQIHGGCDVRGGYTAPRVFQVEDNYALYDNARASIWEDRHGDPRQAELPIIGSNREPACWDTDDGCHWYRNGSCGFGALPQLETYEITRDPADRNGKIFIDADGVAYGPVYGGRLEASF